MTTQTIEDAVRELWKSAKNTPDIVVALEQKGIRVSEKKVLDTATALGLKGSDVQKRIMNNPAITEKWWEEFEQREEESEMKLIERINKGQTLHKERGVGWAKHTVGCTVADELSEKKAASEEILAELKRLGFAEDEIVAIKKDVGF
ncbi:MAG: hypothetical protein JW834_01365 [Candidatus Diapherotrites archaeon]|nr:hypothetical protein [Candidatus Diapherotrites archaeon]